MKEILVAITVVFLLMSSCKKDKEVTEPTRINLLTRVVSQAGTNDSIVQTFTYDASNRITIINQSSNPFNAARVYRFNYNPDGSLAYFDDDAFGRFRFTFNAAGKLESKRTFAVSGGTETLRDTYIFTYAGNVITRNYTPQSGNGFITKYTTAANGNLTALSEFTKSSPADNIGTLSATLTYTNYDNKINNLVGFPGVTLFPENSVNNVGTINYPSFVLSYTYTYNADGYVTKRVDNGGSISLYEYRRL